MLVTEHREMVIGESEHRRSRFGALRSPGEALCVLSSPVALFFILRLEAMAPPRLPDPAIDTTYVVDPRDIFIRYAAVFAKTARLREAARVGFLVPARAFYLAFGALGGFYVFRYVLALVAIVPLYLLLRRTYGRSAGWAGIALVMSNPVFIIAWGTNYSDSAAISYLLGGVCALVMPSQPKFRSWWLLFAAALFTMSVWAQGGSVPLVIAALVAYGLVRALRERKYILRDAAVLASGAGAVTGLLAWFSGLEIGQVNYITPTLQSERFLSRPHQEAIWHSTNWHWLLYDPYLLIPPVIFICFAAVFLRRYRQMTEIQMFIGICGLFVFLTAAYYQFIGKVQLVENRYFSSMLWAFVIALEALVVAEISRDISEWEPFAEQQLLERATLASRLRKYVLRAIPFLVVVGVALGFEAVRHVPKMKLSPWGLAVAAIVVLVVAAWRATLGWDRSQHLELGLTGVTRAAAALAILVGLLGSTLILNVAPQYHIRLAAHEVSDPMTVYGTALAGNGTADVDVYQVISELPGFVGHPAYKGEQLLVWWPWHELPQLLSAIGIFHADFDSVHGSFPTLSGEGVATIQMRRPAQILLMDTTGAGFKTALAQLRRYRPEVIRAGVLKDGVYSLHVELIDLLRYLKHTT